MKDKIQKLHKNHRYIEPLLIFGFGNLTGVIVNLISGEISSNSLNESWNLFMSIYLKHMVFVAIMIIIYYKFLSTYSVAGYNSTEMTVNEFQRRVTGKIMSEIDSMSDVDNILETVAQFHANREMYFEEIE